MATVDLDKLKELVLDLLKDRASGEAEELRKDLEEPFKKLAELTAFFTLRKIEGGDVDFYLNLLKATAKDLGAILLHRATTFSWETVLEICLTVAKVVAKVML